MAGDVGAPIPCRVLGELPDGLAGSYYRIGPHPGAGSALARWGTYPGLLHEITIADGAAHYRSSRMGVGHGPSANVLVDGDDLLGVGEWGPFWAIDRGSLVASPRPLAGGLDSVVAHAHPDPAGRLVVTVVDYAEPSASAWSWTDGGWQLRRSIALPERAFIHDAQVIGADLVLGLHPLVLTQTGLRWDEGAETSTWLVAALDTDDEPLHAPFAPCFVWHGGWASSDASALVMRAPVRPTPGLFAVERGLDPSVIPGVREWTLDHDAQEVRERQLTDDPCDFPVPMGDVLVVGIAGSSRGVPDYTRCSGVAIVGGDGERVRRMHRKGCFGGEFRPVTTSAGVVLVGLVADPANNSTCLMLLDAGDICGPPVATVVIPTLVPAGLHSAWLSARVA